MRTADYKVLSVVRLNDGKKYMYLGYRENTGAGKSHDFEPMEGKPVVFGMCYSKDGIPFVPFVNKPDAEIVAEIVDTPKPKRKGLMRRVLDWWKASNRWKHFLYAIPLGAVTGWDATVGVGFGMELKDHLYGGKADITDFLLTCLGGFIGVGLMRAFGMDHLILTFIRLVI